MKPKRYRINNGVLRFEDGITAFEDYLVVPEGVVAIDFNDLEFFKKPLRLTNTRIKELDFKNVIMVDKVYLPRLCRITEDLYWADKFIMPDDGAIMLASSSRMHFLNVYSQKPLVYLAGGVVGTLDLRTQQQKRFVDAGYAIYSPVNHITHGNPVAEKYPMVVADIDMLALEKCDVIFFDLTKLTNGTCAEIGYAVARGWHKTKRIYYVYNDTKNFFINGLLRNFTRVKSLGEMFLMDKDNL